MEGKRGSGGDQIAANGRWLKFGVHSLQEEFTFHQTKENFLGLCVCVLILKLSQSFGAQRGK